MAKSAASTPARSATAWISRRVWTSPTPCDMGSDIRICPRQVGVPSLSTWTSHPVRAYGGQAWTPKLSPSFFSRGQRGFALDAKAKEVSEESDGRDELTQVNGYAARKRRMTTEEINEFWERQMEEVDRPSGRGMLRMIHQAHPLGIDPNTKGVSDKKDSLFNFYKQLREEHPTKIILSRVISISRGKWPHRFLVLAIDRSPVAQVGDFYEAFGYCAVLLVQVLTPFLLWNQK